MDHQHDSSLPPIEGGNQAESPKPEAPLRTGSPEASRGEAAGSRGDTIGYGEEQRIGVLVITEQGKEAREVRIAQGRIRIGRDPDAEIVLSDLGVSRSHALITRREDAFVLEDLGSLNRTVINGRELPGKAMHVLRHGDNIRLGRSVLRFLVHITKKMATTLRSAKESKDGHHRNRRARDRPLCLFRLEKIEAALVVACQKGPATRHPLEADRVRIGRDPDSDLVISDPSVSAQHAEIVYNKEGFHLVDRDSTVGTFVDGVSVSVARIVHGSYLRLGKVKALFVVHEAGAERPDVPFDFRDHLVEDYPERGDAIRTIFRECRENGLDFAEELVGGGAIDPEEWWVSSAKFHRLAAEPHGFLARLLGKRKSAR